MTARSAAGLPAESETSFQTAVLDFAKLRGWMCAHFRPARTNGGWKTPVQGDAGFVDIVFCRPPRIVFAELKSDKGRMEPAQEKWVYRLAQSGGELVDTYVWRPSDWPEVEAALQ